MAKQIKKKAFEIGELDQYLFGQGTHYEIYKKMGAHKVKSGRKTGVYFAVWAPMQNAFLLWEILMTGIRQQTL